MMTQEEFIQAIVATAQSQGYSIENSRNGRQIVFGNKKLHEGHLSRLYPGILAECANIPSLINAVAPGRPCSHKPMKKIVTIVKTEWEVHQ